jgi:leader peptidase (prepilin peptidase)/N-methyltransferase
MPLAAHAYFFAAFAFVLGAVVGSFLNVCIYRLPLGLSVNEPKRSFCPECKAQIPWHHNLPLLSWLQLRGTCANCGARISIRYFGVELLTALLFLAVWLRFPGMLALGYGVLLSLFVVATFIDFDHFIIPDEITLGGTLAGLALSGVIPTLMGVESHLAALLWSAAGAAFGFFLLWGVVVAGKAAFGRKRTVFNPPASFTWRREGDSATLTIAGKAEAWAEFFPEEKAVLRMKCASLEFAGQTHENLELTSHYETLTVAGRDHDLCGVETFSGKLHEVFFERDAMGFGDVKFIACIGAFLGWKAVLFTVAAASLLGTVVGVTAIMCRRREWSVKLPFGPYLALGATIWLFAGPVVVAWYLDLVRLSEI